MATAEERELKRVGTLLKDIRENTKAPWWKVFANGLLYGIGAVVGTILAIALIGATLSIFGVIPGFAHFAQMLQDILHSKY